MGEDVTKVSPTLGFIIKTIDYEGCVYLSFPAHVPTGPHAANVIRSPLLEMILTGYPRLATNSTYVCTPAQPPFPHLKKSKNGGLWGRELTGEGDVGGQKTLRSYWRNYFEKTDALVWVVDATDRGRVADCKEELAGLLLEEVSPIPTLCSVFPLLLSRPISRGRGAIPIHGLVSSRGCCGFRPGIGAEWTNLAVAVVWRRHEALVPLMRSKEGYAWNG